MATIGHMVKNRLSTSLAVFAVCLLTGIPSAYAQSGKVILPLREMTVKQAMNELQRQTDYKVAVDWEDLDPGRKVFFPSHEMEASELLRTGLAGTNFTWEVNGAQIIVTPVTDDGRNAHSTMTIRSSFHNESMTFVPDPWSRTQKPFEGMFNVRKGYWNPDSGGEDSIGMSIVNYRTGSSTLEKEYMDNARALEILRRLLTDKDVIAGLDYIVITSGSSPEGNTSENEKLAVARALAMKSYLMQQYPYLDRDIIYTFSVGEDWSGLHKMVDEDPGTPFRDQVLRVLDAQIGSDAKRAALRSIGSGEAYRYIASNMLPNLRGAAAATLHFKEKEVREIIVETHSVDTVYVEKITEVKVEKERIILRVTELEQHPLFALKTNLLFDAASAINVEVEIPIDRRWSVAGEWVFPWWLYEKEQYALQTGNGNLEVKHWFGDRRRYERLTGWFAGLYGGAGYYDLEWKTRGWQGEFWHAGINGGYAHTFGRSGNWRMEYTLGFGYMDTDYREYVPRMGEDNEWHLMRRNSGRRTWIGPTQAKISLVWMINHGHRKKEGGAK